MATGQQRAVDPGSRTIAIVPVRSLEGAKSRLGEVLDPEERRDLVVDLLQRTVRALVDSAEVDAVIVVSRDEEALDIARGLSAVGLRQTGGGLNASLEQARDAAVDLGASSLIVVPGDIPSIAASIVDELLQSLPGTSEAARLVGLVPDRHGRGTNLLLLRPPTVIPFAFGGDSRVAHRELAGAAGARYEEREGPLSLDLDTPDDLIVAGFERAEGVGSA
jgi:2-phospho-L-lactate guanylyltransferase